MKWHYLNMFEHQNFNILCIHCTLFCFSKDCWIVHVRLIYLTPVWLSYKPLLSSFFYFFCLQPLLSSFFYLSCLSASSLLFLLFCYVFHPLLSSFFYFVLSSSLFCPLSFIFFCLQPLLSSFFYFVLSSSLFFPLSSILFCLPASSCFFLLFCSVFQLLLSSFFYFVLSPVSSFLFLLFCFVFQPLLASFLLLWTIPSLTDVLCCYYGQFLPWQTYFAVKEYIQRTRWHSIQHLTKQSAFFVYMYILNCTISNIHKMCYLKFLIYALYFNPIIIIFYIMFLQCYCTFF